MRVSDVDGVIMLSKKKLDSIRGWDIVEEAKENHTVMEGSLSGRDQKMLACNLPQNHTLNRFQISFTSSGAQETRIGDTFDMVCQICRIPI